MDRRHPDDLTDEQWGRVEHLIPKSTARTGRPPSDPRLMLDAIFWFCSAGVRCGTWTRGSGRTRPRTRTSPLAAGRRAGPGRRGTPGRARQAGADRLGPVVRRRVERAGAQVRRRGRKKSLDREPKEPADHALGRSKGGFGTSSTGH